MLAQRCPTCGGSGDYKGFFCPMCGGEGLVEDYMMTPAQSGPDRLSDTEQRSQALKNLLASGVVDISDPVAQYEILNLLASGNFTIEDISDSPDLTPNLKAIDNTQTILVNDGLVKGGRTYAIRAKSQTNVLEKKVLGYALDGTLPPGPTVIPLNLTTEDQNAIANRGRTARWKRFDQLMLTFWSNPQRTVRETALARTILLEIIPRFPTKTLQPIEGLTAVGPPYNLPDPNQPGINTSTILYQVDATHNPTHQTMSDLVITRNPAIYLPRYYELQLTINLVGGPCFCDAMIMQTVLR